MYHREPKIPDSITQKALFNNLPKYIKRVTIEVRFTATTMIPKTIHYCWFGKAPKSEAILGCIASWKKHCPGFIIQEWNEENFDVQAYPFTQKMYREKKWAFVADYARLHTLINEGGFYFDTDMFLCKPLLPLCDNTCILGEETDGIISAGMIASTANHPFIIQCKNFYDTHPHETITIPRVLTQIYSLYLNKKSLTVFPPKAFYPFDADHIYQFHGQDLGADVYGVHLWHYSWGHPLNKFFKKVGIYHTGKKIADSLGIKQVLKKILGFI